MSGQGQRLGAPSRPITNFTRGAALLDCGIHRRPHLRRVDCRRVFIQNIAT